MLTYSRNDAKWLIAPAGLALMGGMALRSLAAPLGTPPAAAVKPLLLTYNYKPGETRRYEVTAYFDGHIPPFAQPGSKPVHLLIKFDYLAKVLKQDANGAQVAFTVDAADINLLNDEVAIGAKIDPNDETPFPIELADVQKALNATATLRPDGTVTDVSGAASNIVRVNVGFDLRKLFLLVMPVMFKPSPVHMGEAWTQPAGIIGSREGKISYTDTLISASGSGSNLALRIGQKGNAIVEDNLDKELNSAAKPEDIVAKLSGTVSIEGDMKFMATPSSEKPNAQTARMTSGQFTMKALLNRTATKADLAPEIKQSMEGPIDVKARMIVRTIEKTASR
jgi:hypothetical protein